MKIQFKQQDFQLAAVKSVVDCFDGQPSNKTTFTLERYDNIRRRAEAAQREAEAGLFADEERAEVELLEEVGYRNRKLMITEGQLLKNIQAVQKQNGLPPSPGLERPKGYTEGAWLTVEMETGTGKTYTYIRTMYELYRRYGWSKFIVVVPSVAIREGALKSFELTVSHFQQEFPDAGQIVPFIYNSKRPQDIETFAASERISVMIINTQAFNARGKDARLIYVEQDRFNSRRPIDLIAQTRPVLIIDEPQSVEGKKTLEALKEFKSLFTLRYSATPKVDYNKVFRLDALDAYNRKLVKKIRVKGIQIKGIAGTDGYLYLESISLSATKPPYAWIEFEQRNAAGLVKRKRKKFSAGESIHEASGGIPAYKGMTITEIDGARNFVTIKGQQISPGDIVNDRNEKEFRRIQIREAIKSHLQKEKDLHQRGVKVLTLFFIDTVSKYRQYDDDGNELVVGYGKMFEEEYAKLRDNYRELFNPEYNAYMEATDPGAAHDYLPGGYRDYLQRFAPEQVHSGYFSVDKKQQLTDPKVRSGREESDDESAYALIMKNKERLLSFDEPVRFIFSHSALREGWDNPNVFQICALKNVDNAAEGRRRQEVGRGLRLCVDQEGRRLDTQLLGGAVHDVNVLTVVASESYEVFAKGLQKEIAATLSDRPQRVTEAYLMGKLLTNERGETLEIDTSNVSELYFHFVRHNIIDNKKELTPAGIAHVEAGTLPLPETFEPFREKVTELCARTLQSKVLKPGDERRTITLRTNKNFERREFKALWERISQKTIYQLNYDTATLIEQAVNLIDKSLEVTRRSYEVREGELKQNQAKLDLEAGVAMEEKSRYRQKQQAALDTTTTYDLIGEVEKRTNLTRHTIAAILTQISPKKFAHYAINPEEFIAHSSRYINEVKAALVLNNVTYHKIDDHWDARTVFANGGSVPREESTGGKRRKHIYDYLAADSQIESRFAAALEVAQEVVVYAKLPKTFYVTTPVANYSPDWAIVFEHEAGRQLYFVSETKGSDSDLDLRAIEKLKIECARRHFAEIGNGQVRFERVATYEKLRNLLDTAREESTAP